MEMQAEERASAGGRSWRCAPGGVLDEVVGTFSPSKADDRGRVGLTLDLRIACAVYYIRVLKGCRLEPIAQ